MAPLLCSHLKNMEEKVESTLFNFSVFEVESNL